MDGLSSPAESPPRRSRRRRLAVALGTAAVALLAAAALVGAAVGPAGDRSGAAGRAARPAATPSADLPTDCRASAVQVRLGTARRAGGGYDFPLRIRSVGKAACRLDLAEAVAFTVTAGSERVFRSTRCDAVPDVRTLPPGGAVRTTLHWPARAAVAGGCPATGPATPPGYYVARARIGTATDTAVLRVDPLQP